MSDLLIKRAQPNAAALIEAVADEDADAVAEVLTTLDRQGLYALAVVLAGQLMPEDDDTEKMRKAVAMSAHAFGLSASETLGASRERAALDSRAVAAYVGRLFGLSSVRVGKAIGRDHSTVLNAWGRVAETPRLRGIAHRIAEQLGWDREEGAA